MEVGVGTGKNFPFHPRGAKVTSIDLADQMLLRARERAHRLGKPIDLREGDVQAPDFPDNTFDTAAATFVFRTVPDPRAARVESSGQAGGARFCCSTACALNARSLGR